MTTGTTFVDRFYELLGRRDVDGVVGLYGPGAEIVRYDGVAATPADIRGYFTRLLEQHPGFTLRQIVEFRDADDVLMWDALIDTDNGILQTVHVVILDEHGADRATHPGFSRLLGHVIDQEHGAVIRDVHVVVPTDAFDDDLAALTNVHGFRLDAIFPADSPATAIVSAHGIRLRLDGRAAGGPITLHLLSDDPDDPVVLPGGSRLEFRPFARPYQLPDNRPSLVVSHDNGESSVGRAGMRYRDLVPDRWGGRFIASHITIPEGGPVPDYVHFHNIRFQLIFVKAGWVEVVYEDQGEPFVLLAGDGVLQPPEIRHRVLNSSPGLEVIEIGCPAEHETIADHALTLPTAVVDPDRDFGGQRFVRHIAADATYAPWRFDGWEYRDTGIARRDARSRRGARRPAVRGDGHNRQYRIRNDRPRHRVRAARRAAGRRYVRRRRA